MTSTTHERTNGHRLNAALRLVLRRYFSQVRRWKGYAIPALLLPAVGDVLTIYAPPLVVARLLATFARQDHLAFSDVLPYLADLWRPLDFRAARVARGGRDDHPDRDPRHSRRSTSRRWTSCWRRTSAFFHDNFAGSLTKRALGYARRFEDVFDVLAFQVIGNVPAAGVRRRGAVALLAVADRGAALDAAAHVAP